VCDHRAVIVPIGIRSTRSPRAAAGKSGIRRVRIRRPACAARSLRAAVDALPPVDRKLAASCPSGALRISRAAPRCGRRLTVNSRRSAPRLIVGSARAPRSRWRTPSAARSPARAKSCYACRLMQHDLRQSRHRFGIQGGAYSIVWRTPHRRIASSRRGAIHSATDRVIAGVRTRCGPLVPIARCLRIQTSARPASRPYEPARRLLLAARRILVLEELSSVSPRARPCRASRYGASSDATWSCPRGGMAPAMPGAGEAGLQLDYVNTHATSHRRHIANGMRCAKYPGAALLLDERMTATQWASGGQEAIYCGLMMERGFNPAVRTSDDPIRAARPPSCANRERASHLMTNSSLRRPTRPRTAAWRAAPG